MNQAEQQLPKEDKVSNKNIGKLARQDDETIKEYHQRLWAEKAATKRYLGGRFLWKSKEAGTFVDGNHFHGKEIDGPYIREKHGPLGHA